MSIRVVARIRPLVKNETEKDIIVDTTSSKDDAAGEQKNLVQIPNPRKLSEQYTFRFNEVYEASSKQDDIFRNEVSPTIKHLFQGIDVTMFAYGVTGTGKTHTMRGGKSLADRGIIPRLLSGIYRRSRKVEKDSDGETTVEVAMSYFEIYNDRVYDLFEAPEKRTLAGLPLRDQNGKTTVCGLTERPCATLKDFESLYDHANVNRSTSATKLNAHSSRSHAILRVKVSITTGHETRVSTASAIDLAGSEDNRRTDNGKDRMVESASINKSLFILAQCAEAISKKSSRIPYRESKMTRILSLGQNNGITIMILNLAPVQAFHLDTLSSLNFANRTKTIQVREVENNPVFNGISQATGHQGGLSVQRQPLRPLTSNTTNSRNLKKDDAQSTKPVKAFSVYAERHGTFSSKPARASNGSAEPRRALHGALANKSITGSGGRSQENAIQEMVEKKVEEILAARALNEPAKPSADEISAQVQSRLEQLEQKIEKKQDDRAEGLTYLLMAKQHQLRGEDLSALKMYRLALPYFPNHDKLRTKISSLETKLATHREEAVTPADDPRYGANTAHSQLARRPRKRRRSDDDDDYQDDYHQSSDEEHVHSHRRGHRPHKPRVGSILSDQDPSPTFPSENGLTAGVQTPRTRQLLRIINERDSQALRAIKGVGAKKAGLLLDATACLDQENVDPASEKSRAKISNLAQLGEFRGVGMRTVESMRNGITIS